MNIVVADLSVEGTGHPLAIDDPHPQLSWKLSGEDRGILQSAYQIVAATTRERLEDVVVDLWDSGRVESSESVSVAYEGEVPGPGSRIYWKVRVWAGPGEPSAWSDAGWWERGLGDAWEGAWIGGPQLPAETLTFAGARWIGAPGTVAGNDSMPAGDQCIRKEFDVPADRELERARMLITVDERYALSLNGDPVGSTPEGGGWHIAQVLDLTDHIRAGKNALSILATNAKRSPAAAIGKLVLEFYDAEPIVVATDSTWVSAATAQAGWTGVEFDDSGWPAVADLGSYGIEPWGAGAALPESNAPAPLLRTAFEVGSDLVRGRLYVAAAGYQIGTINGKPVSGHVLEPATTDYDESVMYVPYDVTDLLDAGSNVLAFELGRGFFGLNTANVWNLHRASWHGEPSVRADLVLEYADGSRQKVLTGPDWRVSAGPTRTDSVYAGETYDARFAQQGWATRDFDDSHWALASVVDGPRGSLTPQLVQPIEVVESSPAVVVTESRPGEYIVDFGRTMSGWVEMSGSGDAGRTVRIEYGQQLRPDGTLDLEQGYVKGGRFQRDEYVFSGTQTERWQPRFSQKSFRYIQIGGLDAAPPLEMFVAKGVRTAAEQTGTFTSSNPLYGRIHDIVVRSLGHHMLGIPAVDPMYEKIGWTADGHLNTPGFALNFDSRNFLAKWLDDLEQSQHQDGSLQVIAPTGGWGDSNAPDWTMAYPIVMWELWERFGDRAALSDHIEGVLRYLDSELAKLDQEGLASTVLGDWLPPGDTPASEDRRLPASAYVYRGLHIGIAAAHTLERTADEARLTEAAATLRHNFNSKFFDAEEQIYRTASDSGYRQTSNALSLAFGLVPEESRAAVAEALAANVRANDNHLDTGTLGTAVLLQVLMDTGHAAEAHAIAGQRTYPSWGYWIENGADTLWETWTLTHSGQGRPPGRDHYLFGSIDPWFYESLAGIKPLEPGYSHTLIAPAVSPLLPHVAATVHSVRGAISVDWSLDDAGSAGMVVVPGNATAELHLPVPDGFEVTENGQAQIDGVEQLKPGVYRLGSGSYDLAVRRIGGNPGDDERGTDPGTGQPGTAAPILVDSGGALLDGM
ncbi:alpha-L-rhamnosidase [Microbacterium immunditiarum]|uniref:alpha-L-rhamnosidase n=1 Tax=Microbacterium immunditiarum TaxID=337480 RepID=A0A7Y9KJD7_9MICO|nr:alpha-L-rhamnosidase [Microbacterium immunditiarum]NYE18038.1 alpha-L-rhamnosidase [Microbacterium immunditiarum]